MTIRAVYFDLDDTLCNYMDSAEASRREVFARLAAEDPRFAAAVLLSTWYQEFDRLLPEVRPGGAWRDRYLVDSASTRTELMRRVLCKISRPNMDETEREQLARRLSDEYLSGRLRRLRLYPDAITVLERLGKRLPLGLITNGPADSQRGEIETLGIGNYFENILIEGEVGVGKPDPAIFHLAASRAGADPSETCFVGDSLLHDVRGARTAGLIAVWLEDTGDGAESEADLVARSLTDCADWIEKQPAQPS